jgi:hypothetical protein
MNKLQINRCSNPVGVDAQLALLRLALGPNATESLLATIPSYTPKHVVLHEFIKCVIRAREFVNEEIPKLSANSKRLRRAKKRLAILDVAVSSTLLS